MDSKKVKVRIYGQEYTIVGEKSEEEILEIASYVNDKMHEIGKNSFLGSATSLAVLSAVNITDEMLSERNELQQLRSKNEELKNDVKKYVNLWDEAKKNLIRHRAELEEIRLKANSDSRLQDLERRYKELESSFFDLQMENIKLKSRLGESEE